MSITKYPLYESGLYAFHVRRVGSELIRKRDNASVYFQPGEEANNAEEDAKNAWMNPSATLGVNPSAFDHWASQYFD